MADAVGSGLKPASSLGVAIKVLCGGSLTLCIKSVEFEFDPVKKLDKVKSKGKYMDLPFGPPLRVTATNVKSYGFDTVRDLIGFLQVQLPKTAEGRKSGPAFMYSIMLGKQAKTIESMDTPAILAEIESRTLCKPAAGLTREKAIVALRGLREICEENVDAPEVQPVAVARATAQAKERTLMEDLFAKYNNTASVGTDAR